MKNIVKYILEKEEFCFNRILSKGFYLENVQSSCVSTMLFDSFLCKVKNAQKIIQTCLDICISSQVL